MGYALLRRMLSGFNAAAAVAATYGSVSAVTFVTATQYLESQSVPYGGYMAAAMALMESPAIILAVMLANALRQRQAVPATHAAQMVAMSLSVQPPCPARAAWVPSGSATAGKAGPHLSVARSCMNPSPTAPNCCCWAPWSSAWSRAMRAKAMQPFSVTCSRACCACFCWTWAFPPRATCLPCASNRRGCWPMPCWGRWCTPGWHWPLAWLAQVPAGDAALLMVLAASASYIAMPAVVRYAIPEADPSLYVSLSLG